MNLVKKIHVLDCDRERRAHLSYSMSQRGFGVQIYESVAELSEWAPREGLLLISDELGESLIEKVNGDLMSRGTVIPIAVYSCKPTAVKIVQAMRAGALDYLEWPLSSEKIEEAFEKISSKAGGDLALQQKRAAAKKLVDKLSGRQKGTLRLMISGFGNKAIADEFGISPRTVEIYRSQMLKKLNVSSSAAAIRIGFYAGLDD